MSCSWARSRRSFRRPSGENGVTMPPRMLPVPTGPRYPARTVRQDRLISGDGHVNEPPDLWTSRVPSGFRDRAPHMKRFERGDAWIIEGAADPINFGMNAVAGLPPDQISSWKRFEDIRPGGY